MDHLSNVGKSGEQRNGCTSGRRLSGEGWHSLTRWAKQTASDRGERPNWLVSLRADLCRHIQALLSPEQARI